MSFLVFGYMAGGEGEEMFPREEGFGEPWFPILQGVRRTSLVEGQWLFENASASLEWAESLQLPISYACVAARRADSTG